MTREDLEKTHPDYKEWIEEWKFFVRAYMGGRIYKEGNYLLQHPFESASNYRRRKESSYYYNYCAPIVDMFSSHLFRKGAKRDWGSFTGDELFEFFLRDADMEGSGFVQFMRDAQRFAGIYGRVSIVVDMPSSSTATRAKAIESDIRPYLALITPENLLDWSFAALPSGRPALDMVRIKEGENCYRIWTTEVWELWEAAKDGNEARLIDAGEHRLGMVPVVNLYNRRSGTRMIGVSDLQDIADINKNIYFLCSDAKEIIENTAFPMLAVPYERSGGDSKEIGPRNILQFDPSEPNSKPFWLEAPHSSLTEIREWVKQDIAEIHRIAKMGGVKATEDFASVRSGVALELEYQQLYAVLSEKADNLEHAEAGILDLWARWEGMEFDGRIDYPDDFSVADMERDLDGAIKAQSAQVLSKTFRKELQKKIVGIALSKLDREAAEKIISEIDSGAE
ncbi:MAG: hypothetical protein NUW09_09225 [Deltaproteobacteria bacterium]|nr:hypothetical protein [Deltaproteobacteria bacterium]